MDQFKYLQRLGATPYGNFNILWMELLGAHGDSRLDPSSHPQEQLVTAIECWKERIATRNASPDGPPATPAYQRDGHQWDAARCDRVLAGCSDEGARQFVTRGLSNILIAAERATRAPPGEWQGGSRPRPTCRTAGCPRALDNRCLRYGWDHCCAVCRAGFGGHDERCWCADNPRPCNYATELAGSRWTPFPPRGAEALFMRRPPGTRPTCISPGCSRPLADYVLAQGGEHCCATCRSTPGSHWSNCWNGDAAVTPPVATQPPTPPDPQEQRDGRYHDHAPRPMAAQDRDAAQTVEGPPAGSRPEAQHIQWAPASPQHGSPNAPTKTAEEINQWKDLV